MISPYRIRCCGGGARSTDTRGSKTSTNDASIYGECVGLKAFVVAVIAGDGIGREVMPEGVRVLEAAGTHFGFRFEWHSFDWSCETYLASGKMMPADGLSQLRKFDAIYLGAVGRP